MIKKKNLYEYFYVLIFGIILVQLFFVPGIRLGVLTSIIIIFLLFTSISKKVLFKNSFINKLILLYILYNTVSIVWVVFSGIPVAVFVAEWTNSILPVFFFYFAYGDTENKNNFFDITLLILVSSFILGFFLCISNAPLYRVFMDTTEGAGTDLFNFQSLFGLTATGALGVIGFLISAKILFRSGGRNGKLALIICAVAAIMTLRRSALVVLAIMFVVLNFVGFYQCGFLKKRYLILEIVFLCTTYFIVAQEYGDFLMALTERSQMISDAFSSRSSTWKYNPEYSEIFVGKGLGAVGHKAIGYSSSIISDGNYFKLLAENGILGTVIFVLIILSTFQKGIKNLKEHYLELCIMLSMSLIAIGSNIFTYQSVAPLFWYSIGRISRNNYDMLNSRQQDLAIPVKSLALPR